MGHEAWDRMLDRHPYQERFGKQRKLGDLEAHELVMLERQSKMVIEAAKNGDKKNNTSDVHPIPDVNPEISLQSHDVSITEK